MSKSFGKLFLVPNALDFANHTQTSLATVLPQYTISVAAQINYWICENAKTQRAFLKRLDQISTLITPIQQQIINQLPIQVHKKGDHSAAHSIDLKLGETLLQPALDGHNIGLASEAGMPAIADPGSSIVKLAHRLKITVVPLVGPISMLLALAASGFNGQSFAFNGYLPQDHGEKLIRLKYFENLATQQQQTQIFIETPYRNLALFEFLLQALKPQTSLSVSVALSLPEHYSYSATVKEWQQNSQQLVELFKQKKPAIFLIN